ncbi:hypothetical protein ACN267_22825 [Micromonospora sp. WMMD734]|uniref:Uncharacterized protein n=1 Tax=Micromonospora humidisoli TaxID=2807622 RepID=A0ABS2JAF0_9ACTN|nr:hypothetical protein [Micromonospora humidisoli]MBM7083525.1 hypothetical protein [Micromonospora humidisoli]
MTDDRTPTTDPPADHRSPADLPAPPADPRPPAGRAATPAGPRPPAGRAATPAERVATPGPPADRPTAPLSADPPPTLRRPTAPPRHPTDRRRPDRLAGRITRGGDGPCYGLVTDDGHEYALHGPGLGTVAAGSTVVVTVDPAVPPAACGPGTPVGVVRISVVR